MKCRNKGILFVAIDQNRPLSDQGPFDIVLHKVSLSLKLSSMVVFPWKKHFDVGRRTIYAFLRVWFIILLPPHVGFMHQLINFFTIYWVPVVCSRFCVVLMGLQLFISLFFLHAVVRKGVASDSWGWSSLLTINLVSSWFVLLVYELHVNLVECAIVLPNLYAMRHLITWLESNDHWNWLIG